MATSDRNFYDRYYFNAFDTSGDFMVVLGLGQYPNLQTTDAFVTVRRGDEQHIVRSSKPLEDRSDLSVGPIRVEVLEPLKQLRFVVEPTEHTVAMDLTWEGFGPAIPEPNQFIRNGSRVTFDTQRLAQMGSWSGTLDVDGTDAERRPRHHLGLARPLVGRAAGRREGARGHLPPTPSAAGGMWSYFPMRFEDHCIFYICSEGADGSRSLEQAERVWLDGRVEQLGRTEHDHRFVPRAPACSSDSTISFPDAGFEIECTSLLPNFIAIGTGYGFEEDWRHGMYQGPETWSCRGWCFEVAGDRHPRRPTPWSTTPPGSPTTATSATASTSTPSAARCRSTAWSSPDDEGGTLLPARDAHASQRGSRAVARHPSPGTGAHTSSL